jgi:hypothetical protein
MEDNSEDIPRGFLWQLISVIAFIALATVIRWGDFVRRLFRRSLSELRSLRSHG